jgi:hypothetical protein
MPYAQVSNLDFVEIKTALKDYLRAQGEFTDFDFDGSVWSNLLDVLAYNTYYTAFNTNLVVNELFLDSATLRDNVVSLAKQLGYRPKSITAPKAVVSFIATFGNNSPTNIILKKGTGFVTTFDNVLYQYSVIQDYTVPVIDSVANFNDVELHEGAVTTNFFTVNSSQSSQRFVLQNPGTDTNSIRVKVYPSQNSTSYEFYSLATNILNVNAESKTYFVDETEDEKYEIFFGDGVLGRKLENGEYVEISYIVTNGPESNGARSFTFSGVLEDQNGNSDFTATISDVTTVSVASGGEEIESIKKIKYNAPKYFGTQDRAVTVADYAAIVRNIYPAVADVIVYGGEDSDPPEYGKVKIAVKPNNLTKLSSFTKKEIVDTLKNYMVASVTPEIIDPSIIYVELTSQIYYNREITTQTPEQIKSKVIAGVENYISQSDTEKFNGKFRYSKFVAVIDDTDRSINSNSTTVIMRKDFYPGINSTFYYELCFQNEFDLDCERTTVSSTGFKVVEYPNYTVYLEDRNGKIVLYRLDSLSGEKIVLNDFVGDINYKKGEIQLYDLTIIQGSFFDNRIELRVRPASNDIIATREVYLDVDISNSKFTAYPE